MQLEKANKVANRGKPSQEKIVKKYRADQQENTYSAVTEPFDINL